MQQTILEKAKEDNIQYVSLWFSDLRGIVKNITIPVAELKKALEKGVWFDGSSIEGFARIHESDMYLKPDPETYAAIPWLETPTARLICDIYKADGSPFEGDPRYILKKILNETELKYNVGPEPEFFLFQKENGLKTLSHDVGGYFDLSMDRAFEIRAEMSRSLQHFGIKVEASHHEVAPGQHEIDFEYDDALRTADNVITFKVALKAVAQRHGLHATFMPKPIYGENGSGMHCHQSLTNGTNVFYDGNDKYKLSEAAKSFIAGQLKYVKGMSAVLSPTVNSYKRLVPGFEAPVYICWANVNRSALIRVPAIRDSNAARAELRCPDPSCNPYLAFAVMLKAGLSGIRDKLKLCDPVEEDVYGFDDSKLKARYIETLPGSLKEAIDEMSRSPVVRQVFGEETFWKYMRMKKQEWDDYRTKVHKWEIDRYLY